MGSYSPEIHACMEGIDFLAQLISMSFLFSLFIASSSGRGGDVTGIGAMQTLHGTVNQE